MTTQTIQISAFLRGDRLFDFHGTIDDLRTRYRNAVPLALTRYIADYKTNSDADNHAIEALILHALLSIETSQGTYLKLAETLDLSFDLDTGRAGLDKFDIDVRTRRSARRRLPLADEVAKVNILPGLLAEWHALPLFDDDRVRDACLTKIRKIDPDLAEGLSLRRRAERQRAANDPGG